MKIIKRYKVFVIAFIINIILLIFNFEIGMKSFEITLGNVIEMIAVIPPIFLLIGLLDVWVEKETMMKYLGEGSGIKGIIIAFLLGSVAAGPLYAAFPVAEILIKKNSKMFNVLIFIGAWSTTKIPLLLFEATSLGLKFTLLRLLLDIFGIIGIAYITSKLLSKKDLQEVYELNKEEII